MIPKIGITIGDINGIGPEIALKAFSTIDLSRSTPVLLAPGSVIDFYAKHSTPALNFRAIQNISEISESGVYVLNNSNFQMK